MKNILLKFQNNKIYKYTYISIFLIVLFGNILKGNAYLENYESYKKLGSNIITTAYTEYFNYKTNEKYKNSQEYKELSNLVKIDNIFDVSAKELETKIETKKNSIINKIKDKEEIETGQTEIDDEINKLDKTGRYLLLELPGQLITIDDNTYIYIQKHKIIGNVDVLSKVQGLFDKYRNKEGVINSPNNFKNELVELLQKYQIEFIEIKGNYVPGQLYIGKNTEKKNSKDVNLFISKNFTTPELETLYETKNKGKSYIWMYLTNDDIIYNYNIRDEDMVGSEIYVKNDIFNDVIYLGMVSDNSKILSNKIIGGNLDIFAYKINKNAFEYIIFVIVSIIGIIFGIFLTHNFITNYKNNFKRIPEEL